MCFTLRGPVPKWSLSIQAPQDKTQLPLQTEHSPPRGCFPFIPIFHNHIQFSVQLLNYFPQDKPHLQTSKSFFPVFPAGRSLAADAGEEVPAAAGSTARFTRGKALPARMWLLIVHHGLFVESWDRTAERLRLCRTHTRRSRSIRRLSRYITLFFSGFKIR